MNSRGGKSASEVPCGRGGGELSERTDGRPSGCHRSARNGGVLHKMRWRACGSARTYFGIGYARECAMRGCMRARRAVRPPRKDNGNKKNGTRVRAVPIAFVRGQTRSMARVFASSTPVLATATTVSPLCTRLKYPAIFVACSAASCVTLGWSAARMGCTPQVRAIF